jgi:hypothetical protein
MEQGVVGDVRRQYWMAGECVRSIFSYFGHRFPRGPRYEIITFRCVGCGLLESYSPPG